MVCFICFNMYVQFYSQFESNVIRSFDVKNKVLAFTSDCFFRLTLFRRVQLNFYLPNISQQITLIIAGHGDLLATAYHLKHTTSVARTTIFSWNINTALDLALIVTPSLTSLKKKVSQDWQASLRSPTPLDFTLWKSRMVGSRREPHNSFDICSYEYDTQIVLKD